MILQDVVKEVFKEVNIPGSPRKYLRYIGFIRDPRTGLYGLIIFKNDEYQIWLIPDYNDLNATLNQSKMIFTSPLTDIQQLGYGDDVSIIATTVLSNVYHFHFNSETEQFYSTTFKLENAIFTRQLPDRSALIAATHDGKLTKYSIEGHLQTSIEIPNSPLPKSFAISPNGKIAAIGDRTGKVYIIDIESMAPQHTIETLSGTINCIAFSLDGNQLLVGGKQPIIKLFQFDDLGDEIQWIYTRSFMHHSDTVTTLTLCTGTNVERFASASNDGTVCIWGFAEEEPLHVIKLKDEMATSVNFSPDARFLAITTDEASIRIYKVPFTNDHNDSQGSTEMQAIKENFWELEGNTIFNPMQLRKSLGLFNDETESLIFWKMEANPTLTLKEAYHQVAEAATQRLEQQNLEIKKLRQARKRQRRIIAFQSRVEQMRLAAVREGREFVAPVTPPFSENDESDLSDIEAMFEHLQPPPAEIEPENEGSPDPFASPLSSPVSNPRSKSGSELDEDNQPTANDFAMLSDSDEENEVKGSDNEEKKGSDNEELQTKSPKSIQDEEESQAKSPIQNEEESQAKSPIQDEESVAANESPDQKGLWSSDEEETVNQTSKSPVNEDVEMRDVEEGNGSLASEKQQELGSNASSPLISPPPHAPESP